MNDETGRFHFTKDPVTKLYRKLNIEERTGLICNSNAIEDEVHFYTVALNIVSQERCCITMLNWKYKILTISLM